MVIWRQESSGGTYSIEFLILNFESILNDKF